MKSIAKPFIEYGPIVVFFIFFFKTGEIQGAIVPLMLAAVVAMILSYIVEKKIARKSIATTSRFFPFAICRKV